MVALTTVLAGLRIGNKSGSSSVDPSPDLRIFTARLAYQASRAGQPGPDMAEYLLSYLEGVAKDCDPAVADALAAGVELAMRCGGIQ
jgi:hypothetical protein